MARNTSHTNTPLSAPEAFWQISVVTIGAEVGNARTVSLQMKDLDGNDDTVARSFLFYLSDNADGLDISTDAPSGGVAAGTDGSIVALGTNIYQAVTEADGDLDIVITEAGADTWYLVAVLPTGKRTISAAITFA